MSEHVDIGAEEQALLESLRGDLPSARDRERMRERLAAAGVLAVGTASSATAAAASGNALAGVPAGLVQKIAAWSWSGKIALASVVCAGASTPLALHMLATTRAARVERAVEKPPQLAAAVAVAAQPAPSLDARVEVAAQSARVPAPDSQFARTRAGDVIGRAPELGELRGMEARARDMARVARPLATPAPRPQAPAVPSDEPQPTAAVTTPSTPESDEAAAEYQQPAPRRSETNVFTVEPPRAARTPPLRPRSSTLAEETKLLERALAALQVHDLAAARSWLSLHAARFRDGFLRRERENVWRRVTALGDGTSR
jgi:hypothetical protein